jgi:hypothetical protein
VAIAWAIDYRDARTLASLRETSAGIIAEVVARRGRVAGTGVARRLLRALVPARGLHRRYREFLARSGSTDLRRRERRMVWRAVRAGYRELDRLVELAAALEPGTTPAAASRAILRDVARHPESWSEQLVTLRTVQSLSVLDVRNYRRQVEDLGGYRDEPARGIPARA